MPEPCHPIQVRTERITIVLQRPKFAGNVGFIARCARNMGIRRIIVVGSPDLSREEMRPQATHAASRILDDMRFCDRLEDALADVSHVVGTTARRGSGRGPCLTPREMADRLIGISQENDIALLFGPEDRGLTNDDLRYCQDLVTIPAADGCRSINLSHAVMIVCYELFVARCGVPPSFTPRLAVSSELEGMYGQLRELLLRIGFLNPQNPEYWMMHIRRFFGRRGLYAREVQVIRGICRQMDWFLSQKKA